MITLSLIAAVGVALSYRAVSESTRDRFINWYVNERRKSWRDCYSTGG
jgi:hypothetical protein